MPDETDTGVRLRDLYEQSGGTGKIFSTKVTDYRNSRPDYPAALFDQLHRSCHLAADAVVADIGAGSGLLTRGLLERGYSVIAAEPNTEMRNAANHALGGFPAYQGVNGCAEAIPLGDSSIDLITAAQAFHWFNLEMAKREFLRVLRPRGMVALIWNDRVLTDPLHCALNEIFAEYGGEKRAALMTHEDRSKVPEFFGKASPAKFSWPHQHSLDVVGLTSLVFSRSYMPERDSAKGKKISDAIGEVFDEFAQVGHIAVRYTTVLIAGRPG
jgi:ubiquinone/menaquinone biosynthesis C-methylase UbiE